MPRRRKPAEEQAARGNPGRRKLAVVPAAPPPVEAPVAHPPAVYVPTLEVPPPDYLTEDARRVWLMLAPDLITMKILRRSDAALFGIFCETFAEYAHALRRLQAEGYDYESESQHGKLKRVHPLVLVLDRARRTLFQYGAAFGLTPSDRYRVLQHIAAGGSGPLPPDPRTQPKNDDGEGGLLERAILDPDLSDAGPVGALN